MGDCNPLDGSVHTCLLSQYITQQGKHMVNSFHGGKKSIHRLKHRKSKSFSRKKRSRYNKYAYVHKKQHTYKYRKR